jgi:predicted nucleic acid-binding protein
MVIFDASTLILLARIDLLGEFVARVQGGAAIPDRVRTEVLCGEREEMQELIAYIEDQRIAVVKVKNSALTRKLMADFSIDAGEAEALSLALEKNGSVVATDDRNAIRACKALKLEFITAIAVLVRAVEKGVIEKEVGLIKLQKLQSIGRYAKTIIEDARKQIEGGK